MKILAVMNFDMKEIGLYLLNNNEQRRFIGDVRGHISIAKHPTDKMWMVTAETERHISALFVDLIQKGD